jgi:two-component system sensor histidine kinase DesK
MDLFSYNVDAEAGRPSRTRRTVFASLGLAYLFYPLGDLTRHGGWSAVPRAGAVVVFIVSYAALVWTLAPWTEKMRRISWMLLGVLVALAIACPALFGGDWAGLFIYLAIIMALTLPMRWVLRGVAAATALGVVEAVLLGADKTGLLTIGVTAGTLGIFMAAFRNSRMLNVELRRARAEVARLAATEERLRIARDLHDLLGHSLSLIVLKAEVARRLGEQDMERALGEVADIESVGRQALTDVRAAVSGFRQRNLTEELDSARAVLTAAGITPVIGISGIPLPDVADGLLGWAVREGVTNVIRHSRATRCEISVRREDSEAVLEILDDGAAGEDFRPGNGLTGLAERIQESGGTSLAGPRPEGGFRLVVRAPLQQVAVESPA